MRSGRFKIIRNPLPTKGRQAKPSHDFRYSDDVEGRGKQGPSFGGPTYKLVPGWVREGCPLPRGLGKNRRRRTDEKGGAGDFPRVDQKKRPWPHRCTLRGGFFTFSRNSQRLLDTYITCLNPLLFVMCGQKYMAKRWKVRTEIHGERGQKYIVLC